MMPSSPVEMPSAPFLTEHRLDEKVKKEEGIRALPSHFEKKKGVVRTPKQKVTMKPYDQVFPKKSNVEKVRELMAKREQEKVFAAPSGIPKRSIESQEGKGKKANIKNTPTFTYIKPIKRKTETGDQGVRKKRNMAEKPVFDRTKKFGLPSGLPKRKAETGGAGPRKKTTIPIVNPLKRKAETGGAGPRKKVAKTKLQVTTTGLPPPVQRFKSGAGKKEDDSKPKKSDRLPFPTKRQIALMKK